MGRREALKRNNVFFKTVKEDPAFITSQKEIKNLFVIGKKSLTQTLLSCMYLQGQTDAFHHKLFTCVIQ